MGRYSTVSYPCRLPPAGIETIPSPDSVTLPVPATAKLLVKEGQPVAAGEPLCEQARVGMFASIAGIVTRIMPWQSEHVTTTAVVITNGDCGKTFRLFDACKSFDSLSQSELLEKYCRGGFCCPDAGIPLLVMLLDDDIDRVANRWFFEKEFGRIKTALGLIKKIFPENELHVAVSRNASYDKYRGCAEIAKPLIVKPAYPDATVRAIIAGDRLLRGQKKIAVIDGKQLCSLLSLLETGMPQTTMPVAYRYGKKGQMRMYSVTIGTTIAHLLQSLQVPIQRGMQVIAGGEMTGYAVSSFAHPLLPKNDVLLVLSASHAVTSENVLCVNCGACSRVCPKRLRVETIAKCVERDREDEARRLGIELCTGCSLCTAVCMVKRPLAHLLDAGKKRWAEKIDGVNK